MRRLLCAVSATVIWLFSAGSVLAQTEPFYTGKTVRILVGSPPGGGNDIRTRLFARHVPRHLPGKPQMIVQNMPGAGGLRARNYLYNVAERDGLTIAQILRGTAFQEAIEDPAAHYKAEEFYWIGNLAVGVPVCVVRIDRGGNTLKEAIELSAQKPLRNAESSATSPSAIIALLLKEFVGLNLKVVSGYKGGAAIDVAIERGEADMRCGLIWSSAKVRHADWFERLDSKNPLASVIVQTSENRLADLSDVPTLMELAPDPSWRSAAEAITLTYQNAYPMLAPPGIPDELDKIWREAFWATVHNPEYIAEAKRTGFLDDEPIPGEKVQETIKRIVTISDDVKRRLRKLAGLT